MFINTQKDLDTALSQLKDQKIIAIDTEFVRTTTFYPHLALIQIGFDSKTIAIDAAVGLDLSSIAKIIEDPNVLKIIHAARQDLEVIKLRLGVNINNMFDTQVAAQFLGFSEAPSYDKLVLKYCDQSISKAMQFSDWSERPLSKEQIDYALLDVKYLIGIYHKILAELKKRDLYEWCIEEMEDPETFAIKDTGPFDLLSKFQAMCNREQDFIFLYKLLKVRDFIAKSSDKNRARVMRDEAIIAALKSKHISPRSQKSLKLKEPNLNSILISEAELKTLHQRIKLSKNRHDYDKNIFSAIRALLHFCAQKYDIAPTLISNRDDIVKLVNKKQDHLRSIKGWRAQVFGNEALELLQSLESRLQK